MSDQKLACMAWRNLWRNRRRTILTLVSIAFGTFLAVIFTGMGDSSYSKMIDLAARMGGGHVAIQHPDYLDKPSLSRMVAKTGKIAELALADPQVGRVATRISGAILLSTARESNGAGFIAIDPAGEDLTTLAIMGDLAEGEMFKSSRDQGIILGKKLAENLRTGMGKKVVYTLTDKHGQIVNGLARVSGIISTGAPTVDQGLCLLPIDSIREVLDYSPDQATQVALFLDDNRNAEDVRLRMREILGSQVEASTWDETQPELAGFISMKVAGTKIFELIIMILVAAGIFNTIFISVMERLREFGIMTAIGFSPGSLFRLVMWESLWLALSGLVGAVILSAYPYYYLNTTGFNFSAMIGKEGVEVAGVFVSPIMYVSIYPENAMAIGLAVLLATLAAGLYPAWRAGRVVPVDAIKLV